MLAAHPVHRKEKSVKLCSAFIEGSSQSATGDVFYGIDERNDYYFRRCRRNPSEFPFFYIDNSFFDAHRETYFRITKNRIQPLYTGQYSDGKRFELLGETVMPWRKNGDHIVVCPHSDEFMKLMTGVSATYWKETVIEAIRHYSDRPIVVRDWSRNKNSLAASLIDDLKNAWCLVTWSSAAAITAILCGIPAISIGESAASAMGNDLELIEFPLMREDRYEWASWLADNEWTVEEIRNGIAWRIVNEQTRLV